jgi:anti-anti-sigma factor
LAGVLTGLPDSDRTLEVSDLAFMDVRGAGLLHDHLLARRDRGQQIRLRGASTTLRRIWTVCGFDDTFLDQL